MAGCLLACLRSQQHASACQGWICSDNCASSHTEIAADQPCYLTQSQYTGTEPTSPSLDPITPGTWQGSNWSASIQVTGMTRPEKSPRRRRESNIGSAALEADFLTTRPTRRSRKLRQTDRQTAEERHTDRQTESGGGGGGGEERARERESERER